MKSCFSLIFLFPLLAGCQTSGGLQGADHYLYMYHDYPPGIDRFQACTDVGCEQLASVTLSPLQWQYLGQGFRSAASNAQEERSRVADAVARFEQLVGPVAGTQYDQARNAGSLHPGAQLDCISETVNTTTYLKLMEKQNWLQWHTVSEPRHRGFFGLQAPHNTAVLKEIRTGREYVVDSWFHANGVLPEVVPLAEWLAGYDPEKNKQ